MTTNLLQLPVEAPPAVSPARHDLVGSAQKGGTTGYVENGIRFVPEGNDTVALAEYGTTASPVTKSAALTYPGDIDVPPWLVEAAWIRPTGSWTSNDIIALGTRVFEQTQSSLIELKLAEGSTTGAPYLADSHCTQLGTTAVSSYVGLGRIQQAFAKIGGHGTIYVNPFIAASLAYGNTFVERDGKLYTTEREDLVIVGNFGAKGKSAVAAGTDESWMFGTLGEPVLYLGELQDYEGFDWKTNQQTIRLERAVVVAFVPGQWETLVKP